MLAAILFDLDGTLTNTDPLHFRAWQDTLADYGLSLDQAGYNQHISGRENAAITRDLLPQLSAAEGEQLAAAKEARFRDRAEQLERLTGLDRMLHWCTAHQLQRAIVSNAPRANAEFMLQALDLTAIFPVVVLGEDAPRAKPDPAPYQLALQELGVAAEQAIAFEDSPSGIRSATGAGLTTLGVASTHHPDDLAAAGAQQVIADFAAPELWTWLERLV